MVGKMGGNMVGWWDDGWPGGLAIQSELLLVDWMERN
jgi:hypothetical protein